MSIPGRRPTEGATRKVETRWVHLGKPRAPVRLVQVSKLGRESNEVKKGPQSHSSWGEMGRKESKCIHFFQKYI